MSLKKYIQYKCKEKLRVMKKWVKYKMSQLESRIDGQLRGPIQDLEELKRLRKFSKRGLCRKRKKKGGKRRVRVPELNYGTMQVTETWGKHESQGEITVIHVMYVL